MSFLFLNSNRISETNGKEFYRASSITPRFCKHRISLFEKEAKIPKIHRIKHLRVQIFQLRVHSFIELITYIVCRAKTIHIPPERLFEVRNRTENMSIYSSPLFFKKNTSPSKPPLLPQKIPSFFFHRLRRVQWR